MARFDLINKMLSPEDLEKLQAEVDPSQPVALNLPKAPVSAPAESEEESTDEVPIVQSKSRPSTELDMPAAIITSQPPKPVDPALASYLAKKFGFGEDLSDDALKSAQDRAKDVQTAAMLGRAGATIGAALSGTKVDDSFYNDLAKSGDKGVENILQRRKAEAENINYKSLKEKTDPSSKASESARKVYGPILAKVGMDPKIIEGMSAQQIDDFVKDPINQAQKSKDRELQYATLKATKEAARADKALKNHDLERLPAEDQEVIKDLARSNAKKIAIANQIDSVVKMLNDPSVDDGQKLMQSRQLIKTLNSTEGADAVGAEEAKRLGSFLEVAYGNMTGPGKMRVGRSLPEFAEQAANTSQNIRGAVSSNQKQINDLYKKAGIQRADPAPAQSGKLKVSNGKQTLLIDASDLKDAEAEGFKRV